LAITRGRRIGPAFFSRPLWRELGVSEVLGEPGAGSGGATADAATLRLKKNPSTLCLTKP
jgi:hypothetical protein